MKKRMVYMLVAVVVFIVAIGFVKFHQIQSAIAAYASMSPPPEAVTTVVAAQANWPVTLSAIGTVTAAQGVIVSADLPGTVASIEFESGKRVQAGDVLVRLDSRQEQAQLAAAKAQQHLTSVNLERLRTLRAQGVAAAAEFDQAEAEAMQAEARVNEISATIGRKTIRAPFSGVLGIRQVNLGQYLNPGQAVVPLQSRHPVYVDFAVPQQEIRNLHIGNGITVKVEGDTSAAATGKITAVNSVIDQSTRNVNVRATFDNRDERLIPGMFVEAKASVGESRPVVALPSSSISHAPYGDFIFIVENLKGKDSTTYRGVRQQLVRLGSSRGDQVAIVQGVNPGEEVVTSGVFKLRGGVAVAVRNDVQPENNPTPEPEDN